MQHFFQPQVEEVKHYKPNIVLLDLLMPVGIEILKELREHDATCNIPVLALTSTEVEIARSTLPNLGANDFLQKPVSANELNRRQFN